jgi:hypothetical protein
MGNYADIDKGYTAVSTYASSDVNGVQAFRFVRLTASQTIDRCSAITQVPIGVVQENVDQAKVLTGKVVVDVRLLGISRVTAGAAVAIMAEVSTDTSGRAVTAASTSRVAGIALQAAAAIGDQIDVFLVPAGRIVP